MRFPSPVVGSGDSALKTGWAGDGPGNSPFPGTVSVHSVRRLWHLDDGFVWQVRFDTILVDDVSQEMNLTLVIFTFVTV